MGQYFISFSQIVSSIHFVGIFIIFIIDFNQQVKAIHARAGDNLNEDDLIVELE